MRQGNSKPASEGVSEAGSKWQERVRQGVREAMNERVGSQ